jgi:hypothetical protein
MGGSGGSGNRRGPISRIIAVMESAEEELGIGQR